MPTNKNNQSTLSNDILLSPSVTIIKKPQSTEFDTSISSGGVVIGRVDTIEKLIESRELFLELHIYDNNGNYILSNHCVTNWEFTNENNTNIRKIKIDLDNNLRGAGLSTGQYQCNYRLYRRLIGKYPYDQLSVNRISKSRTELEIKPFVVNQNDLSFNDIINIPIVDRFGNKQNLILNFGSGVTYDIVNWQLIDNRLLIKVEKEINEEIEEDTACAICWAVSDYIGEFVQFEAAEQGKYVNVLAGANFNAKVNKFKTNDESELKNWNSLIGTNQSVSNQILNKYIDKSADLNINYNDFSEFIFYSSAARRLDAFKYKIREIEEIDNAINLISLSTSSLSSSVIVDNLVLYNEQKNTIIGTFDGFETEMYYSSGSTLNEDNEISADITWPKRNAVKPYILYSYTSSEVQDWYDIRFASASFYDKNNYNALRYAIPEKLLEDENNADYITFIEIVAHQFDIIWLYIKNMVNILDRNESPTIGIAKDLVYHMLNAYGWSAEDTAQFDDMWGYFLGNWEDGTTPIPNIDQILQPSQSLVTCVSQSLSKNDIMRETWKRLLNNLPYILKNKGNRKGLQAILNIHGVPSTILRIKEYGGQNIAGNISHYNYDKFNYAMTFNGHDCIYVPKPAAIYQTGSIINDEIVGYNIITSGSAGAIEFRFKAVDSEIFEFPTTNESWSYQSLYRTDDGGISFNISHSSGNYGALTFGWSVISGTYYDGIVTAIDNVPIFDGNWWSLLINKHIPTEDYNLSQSLDIYLKQSNYAEITNAYSGTIMFNELDSNIDIQFAIQNAFITSSRWRLGGGQSGPTGSMSGSSQSTLKLYPFTGSMQEFRYWKTPISESVFNNHVLSPLAHNANNLTSSYDDLLMRLPLGSDLQVLDTSSYISSSHPNYHNSSFNDGNIIRGNYYDFSAPITKSYESVTEEYSLEWPDISGNRQISNKIRLDNNTLNGSLNVARSVVKSSNEQFPNDTNKIGVYFSPTNEVNENIAEIMGAINLDDYIGDYYNIYSGSYSAINSLRNYYFQQFDRQFGTIDYIRLVQYFNQSMWQQIKKMVPARAAILTGLVIEPHILNRSVARILRNPPTSKELSTSMSLDISNNMQPDLYTEIINANINAMVDISSPNNFVNSGSGVINGGTIGGIIDLCNITSDTSQDTYNINITPWLSNYTGGSSNKVINPINKSVNYYYETTYNDNGDYSWANDNDAFLPGVAWIDPEFACKLSGSQTAIDGVVTFTSGSSQTLKLSGYGINVPANAEIIGVEVVVVRRQLTSGSLTPVTASDLYVGISTDCNTNITGGINHANNAILFNDETWRYDIYGSVTDTWGYALTPELVNSSSFGVHYQISASSGLLNAFELDGIGVSIAYRKTENILLQSGSFYSSSVNWYNVENDKIFVNNIMPCITSSRKSERLKYQLISQSISDNQTIYNRTYYPADIRDVLPKATRNHRWSGCKVISTNFNEISYDTINQEPAIEIYVVNPNIITVNQPGITPPDGITPTDLNIE